jgi:8-oxo-dGTP pyrophosphatase MutT (NUDIX family)
MYIKIYFDGRPLFLCDAIEKDIEPYLHHDDAIFMDELDAHGMKTMIHEMQQNRVHAGVYLHADFEALKKSFFKKFTLVQAAGGLVLNPDDDVLMIFRRGSWDLPKGKLDEGETLARCAIREVGEETGLQNVELVSPLVLSFHTYHEGTKYILKETHWFTMKVNDHQRPTPQAAEGILECKWIPVASLDDYLLKAYPQTKDIIDAGMLAGFIK